MKYFVDLDDTLVNSTKLNNDAYNFAIEKFGYARIETQQRITRQMLAGYNPIDEIIRLKQDYCVAEWVSCRVIVNYKLLQKLKCLGKESCFIWTTEELIESAVNFDKFWEFAGTYYKLKAGSPIIIIDREQSVGGYNNSELTLLADKNSVVSNDKEFQTYINAVIGSKEKTAKAQESEEDSLCI